MFADILKKLRNEKGITQEELARAINVDRSSIGKYEGKSNVIPSDDVKRKIAEFFGVSMDYLMEFAADGASAGALLSQKETRLVNAFRALNPDGQAALLAAAESLAMNPSMTKDADRQAG